MNVRRVGAICRKETLHVVRDPRSLILAIGIPVLLLVLFGYALTLDVDNVPLVVWDQSNTPASRELVSRFSGSRYFSLRRRVDNDRELVRDIDAGAAMVALVVPRTFDADLSAGRATPLQLIVDGSDSNTATIAIGYAQLDRREVFAGDVDRGSSSGADSRGRSRPWTSAAASGSTRTWSRRTTSSPDSSPSS